MSVFSVMNTGAVRFRALKRKWQADCRHSNEAGAVLMRGDGSARPHLDAPTSNPHSDAANAPVDAEHRCAMTGGS